MTVMGGVETEIRDWYRRYQEAWEQHAAETIAALTDPSVHGTMVMMDGLEHWNVTYEGDIEGIRGFFSYVQTTGSRNEFQVYDIALRSPDEAIVLSRKTITITGGEKPRTTTQFALETLRRAPDGDWKLVRYWAEKARLHDA